MGADTDRSAKRRRVDGIVWLWLAVNAIAVMAGVNSFRGQSDAERADVLVATAIGAAVAVGIGLVGWTVVRTSRRLGAKVGDVMGRIGPLFGAVMAVWTRGQAAPVRFGVLTALLVLGDIVVFTDSFSRWSNGDDIDDQE